MDCAIGVKLVSHMTMDKFRRLGLDCTRFLGVGLGFFFLFPWWDWRLACCIPARVCVLMTHSSRDN